MFDFSFGELALIVMVALLVVGPRDLPRVMFAVGRWMGQFKGIADDFRQGFRTAMREHELEGVERDLEAVQKEIQYIRDRNGELQRVYDITDFLDDRERSKVTVAAAAEAEKKPPAVLSEVKDLAPAARDSSLRSE